MGVLTWDPALSVYFLASSCLLFLPLHLRDGAAQPDQDLGLLLFQILVGQVNARMGVVRCILRKKKNALFRFI